jgi:hypothetical protein
MWQSGGVVSLLIREAVLGMVSGGPVSGQVKIGGRVHFAAVQQDVVGKSQYRRLAMPKVIEILVSPASHGISK